MALLYNGIAAVLEAVFTAQDVLTLFSVCHLPDRSMEDPLHYSWRAVLWAQKSPFFSERAFALNDKLLLLQIGSHILKLLCRPQKVLYEQVLVLIREEKVIQPLISLFPYACLVVVPPQMMHGVAVTFAQA